MTLPSNRHSTADLCRTQAEAEADASTADNATAGPQPSADEVGRPTIAVGQEAAEGEGSDRRSGPSDEGATEGRPRDWTPTTDIMGVQSSKGVEGVRVVAGSVDWLSLSVYGWWSIDPWRELAEKLETARKLAQDGKSDACYVVGPEGDRVWVEAQGRRHGCYCRYSLLWRGIMIDVVADPRPSEHRLSVYVQIPSTYLMAKGCEFEAADDVRKLLTSLGFHWEYETVSRVDVCTDVVGIRPADLGSLVAQGHYVGYARKFRPYCEPGPDGSMQWHNWEAHPGGAIMLRVYDKHEEVTRGNDLCKYQLMLARWGDDFDPSQGASRVEFEMKRKALKQFSVNSLEEWKAQRAGIVEYLTSSWFRVTDGKPDKENKNQSRATVLAAWQTIQAGFAEAFGVAAVEVKRIRNLGQGCAKLIAQQFLGYASRIAAESGRAITTAAEAAEFVVSEFPDMIAKFADQVTLKRRRLERSSPGVVINLDDIPF